MSETKKEFVDGVFVNSPRSGAPTFVKANISILVDKFIPYLQAKANAKGYVNIDLLENNKEGKLYAKLNDWKPSSAPAAKEHEMAEDEEVTVEESFPLRWAVSESRPTYRGSYLYNYVVAAGGVDCGSVFVSASGG
jgi:hypothetical protein